MKLERGTVFVMKGPNGDVFGVAPDVATAKQSWYISYSGRTDVRLEFIRRPGTEEHNAPTAVMLVQVEGQPRAPEIMHGEKDDLDGWIVPARTFPEPDHLWCKEPPHGVLYTLGADDFWYDADEGEN